MAKTTSKTQGSHTNLAGNKVYKTTISSGSKKTTAIGHTPKASQKAASKKR